MDIYAAIHHRRSHRLYKPDPPPRQVLERVVEAALWAPSGINLQGWDLCVMAGRVRDEFVALVSQAIKYLLPELKKANVPGIDPELVMKFFKDLGGAPVVIAVTIFKDPPPRHEYGQPPERRRPHANPTPGGGSRRPGHLLDDRG